MQQILESAHNFGSCTGQLVDAVMEVLIVVLAVPFLVSVTVELFQGGFSFQPALLRWRGDRLSLVSGIRRLLGVQEESFSLLRTPVWEFLRIALLLSGVSLCLPGALKLMAWSDDLNALARVFVIACAPMFCIVLLWSLLAFAVAFRDRETRLQMTLEELKQDLRDTEGRGEFKQRRYEFQQEIPARPALVITEAPR